MSEPSAANRSPSAWDRIWTPHRMSYIKGEGKPAHERGGPDCPFCRAIDLPDEEGLIVARGKLTYIVLNLYPYNSGHLLVCPYRHVADYPDLSAAEVQEFGELTQWCMRALRQLAGAQGFNVGMNQGELGGAGIAAHLHQHVVPRWHGDTNFMPVVAGTKVLPQLLEETRDLLAAAWVAGLDPEPGKVPSC